MNIFDPALEQKIPALWRQAFRPMFLFASVFSALSMLIWALFLTGKTLLTPYGGMMFWHSHEMLFGFVPAILVGFLLTAVQNWTGIRATHGKALVGLTALWIAGRIIIATNLIPNQWIVLLVDVSFLVVAAFFMAQLVLKVKQYRNLIFVPILLLLASANLLSHLSIIGQNVSLNTWGNYTGVFIITLVMSLIAGRVFPMFTANGTQTSKVNNLAWLELLVIISTVAIAIVHIANLQTLLPKSVLAGLFAIAAIAHAIRAIRWRPQVTFKTPLVWSLHAAYWFIPVSFALFAMHYMGENVLISTALHGLTAGAISSLILAMIARIALGHSGRPLTPHWMVKYGFVLIILAGITRLCAGHLQAYTSTNLYVVAAFLWVVAYLIYILFYWKILTTPRPDGRPG